MIEKKREKLEDFIGWKSDDEKLEVIGIADTNGKNGRKLFKVTCTECSKDPELFPEGYFVSQKGHLVNGLKPCGCGRNVRWKGWQYLILARRAAKDRFVVHGFSEEFKNCKTKLNLECLKDRYKWTASITNIISLYTGCPKCKYYHHGEQLKASEHVALQKCTDICKEMDYDAVGFVDGYKGVFKTRFEYVCKIHGKQNVSYNDFIHSGTRCNGCWVARRKEASAGFYGLYPERKDEKDFLYILNFNNKFIKIGRSFDINNRIKKLKSESKIKNIYRLRIFTATHQKIYGLEQELHDELRARNFQHYVGWSTECFENDSLFILNKMLDECGLEEVIS